MSENTLYALARSLQQTNGLERDFNQMLSALRNTIETEYVQKIRTAAKTEKNEFLIFLKNSGKKQKKIFLWNTPQRK